MSDLRKLSTIELARRFVEAKEEVERRIPEMRERAAYLRGCIDGLDEALAAMDAVIKERDEKEGLALPASAYVGEKL